jgi:multidrug efflux pump subunit AcrB
MYRSYLDDFVSGAHTKACHFEKVISNSMEGISVITVRMDPDQQDHSRILADIQKAVDRAYTNLTADLP